MIELCHGSNPFAEFPPLKVLVHVLQGAEPPVAPPSASKDTHTLIDACLRRTPMTRTSADELLKATALTSLPEAAARHQLLSVLTPRIVRGTP